MNETERPAIDVEIPQYDRLSMRMIGITDYSLVQPPIKKTDRIGFVRMYQITHEDAPMFALFSDISTSNTCLPAHAFFTPEQIATYGDGNLNEGLGRVLRQARAISLTDGGRDFMQLIDAVYSSIDV